ncbi:hypothetical protein N4G41_17980 [Kosakonia sacchari]|nr:hypothetical protein [Kosakonia sacchari]MDZ7323522.1 hypothetical protein [Kosakonia sacchari]
MARYAPFFCLKMENFEEDRKKKHLKYGFFENKKSFATKMKRRAEFMLFL